MSDLHIGASNCDKEHIKRDLEKARTWGARVLLGGDVFDAIYPKDSRRYLPSVLDERLHGVDDVMGHSVGLAVELLGPYADIIDVIGAGNHETAVLKHHSIDLTSWLVQELNRLDKHNRVKHMGYTAFVRYNTLARLGGAPVDKFDIWFHHGSGSSSTPASALAKLCRAAGGWQADCYWQGHHHTQVVSRSEVITADGPRAVHFVSTGGYTNPYRVQSGDSILEEGWRNNYASEAGLKPQSRGGVMLKIEGSLSKKGRIYNVSTAQ